MHRIYVAILALFLIKSPARAGELEAHDVALSIPYAAKAAVPLLLVPGALERPSESGPLAGTLLAAMTFPNAMALAEVYTGDSAGATRWRKAVFWCDLGLAAAATGLGSYLLASHWMGPGSRERRQDRAVAGGFILGAYALPLFGSAFLDRKPFRMEAAGRRTEPALEALPSATGGPALVATSDWLLASPYALKAVLPLFLLPAAIMDPDVLPAAGAFLAGVTFPNAMVLHRVADRDAAGTGKWRKIAFGCELGMAAALAGYGGYLIASSSSRTPDPGLGWDAVTGVVLIGMIALPMAAFSLLDLIPFKLEEHPARFSLGLRMPPPGPGSPAPGLAVALSAAL